MVCERQKPVEHLQEFAVIHLLQQGHPAIWFTPTAYMHLHLCLHFIFCLSGVLCGPAHSVLSLPALDIGVGGTSPGVGTEAASFVDLGRDHMTVTIAPAQWVQEEVSCMKRAPLLQTLACCS